MVGPVSVSPSRRLIEGPAGTLHVEPLIMQVFLLLLDAAGQVVTRNQLFDACWGGANVGDDSLNRAITMVRRIATETCPGLFEIENVPRTGYRLTSSSLGWAGATATPAPSASQRIRLRAGAGAAIAAIAGVAALPSAILDRPPGVPVLAVSTVTDGAFPNALARKVLAEAGRRGANGDGEFELVDATDEASSDPAFVLRLNGSQDGLEPTAEMMLLSGRDGTVVWTASLKQPRAKIRDLEQQVGTTGSQVLACAAETEAVDGKSPDQATVKLFIDACSRFDGMHGANLEYLTDVFRQVTTNAPGLRGAWSRLFLSEAEVIEAGHGPDSASDELRRVLADWRKSPVDVPEVYIARGALLPRNAHFRRLALYQEGLARHPRSLYLHLASSWQLRSVGRMEEAVWTALRAVRLYPNSPAARAEYASSLMYSGRAEAAKNELNRAGQIWPGAPNITNGQFRLALRYGDPRRALEAIRSGETFGGPEEISFLQARLRPSKANVDRAIAEEAAFYRAHPKHFSSIVQVLGEFGRNDEVIDVLLNYKYPEFTGDNAEVLFRPALRGVRRDLRFMQVATRLGLTAFWQQSGKWPDFCSDGDQPYDCRREAAKYR